MTPMSRMQRLVQYAVLSVLLIALGACTGSNVGQSSDGNPNMISQEQIQEAGSMSNAYNLVQRLRPNWLRKRGPSSVSSQSDIVVYVEGSRQGPPSTLRQINVIDVESMEFLSDNEATSRFGSGHDHGAILVHLKSSG